MGHEADELVEQLGEGRDAPGGGGADPGVGGAVDKMDGAKLAKGYWPSIIRAAVKRHPDASPAALLKVIGGRQDKASKTVDAPLLFDQPMIEEISWGKFQQLVKGVSRLQREN